MKLSPGQLLSSYLIHSCLYYEMACQEIDDFQFDRLAKDLLAVYDQVDHPHKHLVILDNLKASTSGAYITFPSIVRSCAAEKARHIPGSILHEKTDEEINTYLVKMMGKNSNI